MTSPFDTDTHPEDDVLELSLPESGTRISSWTSYQYNENFLTPADGWHFTIADDQIPDALMEEFESCPLVELRINGHLQSSGRVSRAHARNSPHGGTEIVIEGRDCMGPVVDSHLDPQITFPDSADVFDVLSFIFSEFGLASVSNDNDANRNIITGQKTGSKKSKRRRRELKSYKAHKLKPYPQEGAFAFAARVAERFGLWCWPYSSGQTVCIGQPDFDQQPIGALIRKIDGTKNNILDGGVTRDYESQPSIIFATAGGGGGEFAKATLRACVVNPCVTTDLKQIFARYPSLTPLDANIPGFTTFFDSIAKPLYLEDPDSTTQEQLEGWLLRQLSHYTRRALTARYDVEGHTINGAPIACDTVLDVDDDRGRIHQRMWVIGRTLSKGAAGAGTKTSIDLIAPNTILF